MQNRMDWRAVAFDWNRVRAFLVTAEEGSFSAAGRALGLSQPTLGRQVAALEEELGVTLFERIGTTLELTGPGLELLDHARAMGEAANRLSFAATGQSTAIEGPVRVTAGEAIAAFLLPPVITGLRRDHPRLAIELVATGETRDLLRREADIAIRNFRSQEPELVARRLGDLQGRLYAVPELVERARQDPSSVEVLAFERSEAFLTAIAALGLPLAPEQIPVATANHLVQWELCRRGVGACIMLEAVGDAEPRVRRMLPEMPAIPVPIWLTCHREVHTSRRIRVVFDRLAEALLPLTRSAESSPPQNP